MGYGARFLFFFSTILFLACNKVFIPVQNEYESYRISQASPRDTSMVLLMKPYRDSIEMTMNQVIGATAMTLEKKSPQGSLGSFMADAMLFGARDKFDLPVDVSFINSGGIRLEQLPRGEITRGKIFELMPFDNVIVVQELKGSELQQLLDVTASRGGWPLSGLSMQIKDKKAVNVRINGQPLDINRTYLVANSDYVANGGDDANILRQIPQKNLGYLLRDAIFDHIRRLMVNGQPFTIKEETRVSNAE